MTKIDLKPREVLYFRRKNGSEPAKKWLQSLKDQIGKARIFQRLLVVETTGNLGEYRDLKNGLFEFKYKFSPGYRVYFCLSSNGDVIILLMGGDKSSQNSDIRKANELLNEYRKNPEYTEKENKDEEQ